MKIEKPSKFRTQLIFVAAVAILFWGVSQGDLVGSATGSEGQACGGAEDNLSPETLSEPHDPFAGIHYWDQTQLLLRYVKTGIKVCLPGTAANIGRADKEA